MQGLRSAGDLHFDEYQSPLAKVLDPYLYLRGRFYDPIVISCILRSAQRHDLRTSSIEKLLRRAVGEKLSHRMYAELRSEVLLAITLGKLPRPFELKSKRRELFNSGEPGIRSLLQVAVSGE